MRLFDDTKTAKRALDRLMNRFKAPWDGPCEVPDTKPRIPGPAMRSARRFEAESDPPHLGDGESEEGYPFPSKSGSKQYVLAARTREGKVAVLSTSDYWTRAGTAPQPKFFATEEIARSCLEDKRHRSHLNPTYTNDVGPHLWDEENACPIF